MNKNDPTEIVQDMTEEQIRQQTEQNKCGGCGAGMTFDIESGGLICRHCGSKREMEDGGKVERRKICNEVLGKHKQWTETRVFQCSNCSAKEVLEKSQIAKSCPFCGSAHVVVIDELPGIKPDSVIPFQITEPNAIERFKKWLKSRWFTPNAFKRADIRAHMNKLYTPCWSFSSRTTNIYNGTLGRTVTYTVGHGENARTVTRTNWFHVRGQFNQAYVDVFYQSGNRISTRDFNRLKPYDLRQVKVYRQEFLSGIIAEHYSRTLEQCFDEFANFVRGDVRRRIINRYHADTVGNFHVNTTFLDRHFNYVLLPLYISNYTYKGKLYNFYINGATGKVVGKYPRSGIKIAGLVIGILALIGAGIAIAMLV